MGKYAVRALCEMQLIHHKTSRRYFCEAKQSPGEMQKEINTVE
jgi:hypothetical protein